MPVLLPFLCHTSSPISLRQKTLLSSEEKARPMIKNKLKKIAKLATGLAAAAVEPWLFPVSV